MRDYRARWMGMIPRHYIRKEDVLKQIEPWQSALDKIHLCINDWKKGKRTDDELIVTMVEKIGDWRIDV